MKKACWKVLLIADVVFRVIGCLWYLLTTYQGRQCWMEPNLRACSDIKMFNLRVFVAQGFLWVSWMEA